MRPVVQQQRHRTFLLWRDIGGLDEVAVDGFTIPAGEGEGFVGSQGALREQGLVEPSEAQRLPAVDSDGIQIRRTAQGARGVVDTIARDAEGLDASVAGDSGGAAAAGVDPPQRTLSQMIRGRNQALAVGRPGETLDGSIPVQGERPLLAAREREQRCV